MVVFCTTCKGRAQHVEKTLPKNLADNVDYPNCKFVLVDYSSPDHLSEYLRTNHADAIASGRLVVYSFKEIGPFRMAHAKNMAHRLGIREGADVLVNLDADNLTEPGFASYVASEFQAAADIGGDIYLWAKMIKGDFVRGISGRIACTADTFLRAGGYDEKYSEWSPDDKDFTARLRRFGCIPREIPREFLGAVPHNDKLRFRDYPQANPDKKDSGDEPAHSFMVNPDPHCRIANYGRFGRGIVYRNFGTEPTVLGELPTRIFGIGWHKTATTSLHRAFQTLGYDSAHWKNAHWAKAIWAEMNQLGKSPTVEGSYALSDMPIGLLYSALDLAYPGSKFILTVREGEKWLNSVRNHFDPERNPFQGQWDTDPFSHRLHLEMYGRKKFDADIFMARYRRHNAEVMAYFKHRPHDLLVMNMDTSFAGPGAGWKELCGFLNQPVPESPYPTEFKTADCQSPRAFVI